MADKVNLTDLVSLQNETTAITNINNNNAAITAGFDNTLSLDGTIPNQMGSNLDMNSNQILNLPVPATANSPARLVDVVSPATIAMVPPVGTSGAVVGLLNANNITSGNNTHTGVETFQNNATFSGTQTFTGNSSVTYPATFSIPFLQNGTGAVQTTVDAKLKYIIDCRDYGCTDGGDNTTAISQAIAHAQLANCDVLLPPGTSLITQPITITAPIKIRGHGCEGDDGLLYGIGSPPTTGVFPTKTSGWHGTTLIPSGNAAAAGNAVFKSQTNGAVCFEDFQIVYTAQPASGSFGINWQAASTTNTVATYGCMRDVIIIGADVAVNTNNVLDFIIDSCVFLNCYNICIVLNNSNGIDYTGATSAVSIGDSTIVNSTLINCQGAYLVKILNGGGYRFVNNKFNSTRSNGSTINDASIWVNPQIFSDPFNSNPATFFEPFIVVGNSFEGSPTGILFSTAAASATADQIVITGNQFFTSTYGLHFEDSPAGRWISSASITGNVFLFGNVGGGNETGIYVQGGLQNTTISGNSFSSSQAGNNAVTLPSGTPTYAIVNNIRQSGNIDGEGLPTLPNRVPPAFPSTNVEVPNNYPYPVNVVISRGAATVSSYVYNKSTDNIGLITSTDQSLVLRPSDTITINYTGGTPTWGWFAINP